MSQQQIDTGIRQHLLLTGFGVIRIDRHIGSARLLDGVERDHHRYRTLGGHADQTVAVHALPDQGMRQLVGGLVQFGIAQALVAEDQGFAIRVRFGLMLE
ncbi:hypothetical protein RE428_35890 [Marinobacter nanhaiticus D15-8W]|nr:hypothetical protein RE428_35890 [Marinobacter nanhaiticus D15-8W]